MAKKSRRPTVNDAATDDTRSMGAVIDQMRLKENEKVHLDQASPKEVKRTTVIFNEEKGNNRISRHSEQIGNLDGYFQQKQALNNAKSAIA